MVGTLGAVAFAAIGGVLFGLDQGNWGGAIVKEPFIRTFCHGSWEDCSDASRYPAAYAEFLSLGSSFLQLGAASGALVLAPFAAGRWGRREAMALGSLITISGCVPQSFVSNELCFLAARFLAGIGVGVVTYALPMFISEVVEPEYRGALGCSMQLTMVIGTVIASILNVQSWFSYNLSFLLPTWPAALVAMGIFFFPVSPRFALIDGARRKLPDGGDERAWKALRQLRGSDDAADEELNELRESLRGESDDVSWRDMWGQPSIRRRIVIANMLQWLQQFTGINAILSYGPPIFQSAGVPLNPLQCAVLVNVCNLLATIFMTLVIDRWGRRTLLLIGASAMCLFLSAATWLAWEIEGSPESRPLLGCCLLACVCLYMCSFAIAWGGVPWVYPSEIFPMSVKEKAMSTSVFSQWLANFLIAFLVPQQVAFMKVSGTFLFYSVCLAIAFVSVWMFVPETKGLLLEEMGKLFGELPENIGQETPGRRRTSSRVGIAGAMPSSCSFVTLFRPPIKSASVPANSEFMSMADVALLRRRSEGGVALVRPLPVVRSRICLAPGGFAAIY
eukprot:CAMPEP_0194520284 /NCGR_PEP_ID=MMETSP0253-20130528/54194_1 /TAXON_ID=2966 /ORGANISM="Noctiluca scintillans" /LENGTH=561 /DNA_ID=CAMNT_0039364499 /DNA_START=34 /DNA_END=1719 /DNA_ORIENTATION=+